MLCDLEHDDPRPHLGAADAIVFAAGAGPGSGPERKRTVDYGGAVKLIEAAEELGVRRYLIVSSIGAGDPASASEAMRAYQQAKHDADEALAASSLDWTIVRPGRLTDAPAAGTVALARRAATARSPARTSRSCCSSASARTTRSARRSSCIEGDVPVREAVAAL